MIATPLKAACKATSETTIKTSCDRRRRVDWLRSSVTALAIFCICKYRMLCVVCSTRVTKSSLTKKMVAQVSIQRSGQRNIKRNAQTVFHFICHLCDRAYWRK